MMQDRISLDGYKSILCLNGDLPEASFFKRIHLPVIAADGAANRLLKLGITPQLIVGDLDSVHADVLQTHPFIHMPDQNLCDYQKALQYLESQDLLPAIIVGIHGGFIDHTLNNINIFMSSDNLLYSPSVWGLVIKESCTRQFHLPKHTKISLIGIPQAIMSSKGLKWELNKSHLTFPGQSSCFNRTIAEEITLEVHDGSALVLIYDEIIEDAGRV